MRINTVYKNIERIIYDFNKFEVMQILLKSQDINPYQTNKTFELELDEDGAILTVIYEKEVDGEQTV